MNGVITDPAKQAEIASLQATIPQLKKRADEAIAKYGMKSPEFASADSAYGKALKRWHQLTGRPSFGTA